MDNYQLLQQILVACESRLVDTTELPENMRLSVWVDFANFEMTLTHSIGPISPRSRSVKLTTVGGGHSVEYSEVTHGVPQPASEETVDTSYANNAAALIERILAHLRGD